jgi:hypothetical protein
VTVSNRSLLEKADLAIADLTTGGGYLRPAQAKKFLRLLIKQSELMRWVTAVPMSAPSQSFPKISFTDRVLRPEPAMGPIPAADRSKPDIDSVQLDSKAFKGEVRLYDQVIEDNVEEGMLRQTIMELIAEAVARDAEDIVINGDVTSPDPTLAQLDGIVKQATSHVVDAAGAPLDKNLLTDLLKSLPSQYMKLRKQMKYMTAVDAELDYRNRLADRETAAGDRYLESDAPVLVAGVPLTPVPLFPDNLGAGGDQTVCLLAHPKNIYVGFWKKIKIETARDISEGCLKIVVRLRMDAKYADEQGVAKLINVQL